MIKTHSIRHVTKYNGMVLDTVKYFFSGDFNNRSKIREFEDLFAKYIGTKYAIAVCSARTGLKLLLRSLGLNQNDKIVFPSCTHKSMPKAALDIKLNPVFCDIDKDSYNIDLKSMTKAINKHKPKVVIATHLFGSPSDIKKINNTCKKQNIIVIEDCCQALGAEYNNQKVGSIAKAGIFSFDTIKGINCFGGGIITTNDKELADKIRNYQSNYPINKIKMLKKILLCYTELLFINPTIYGTLVRPFLLNSFMSKTIKNYYKRQKLKSKAFDNNFSGFQAKLGIKQLNNLEKNITDVINKAELLRKNLSTRLKSQKHLKNSKPIYYIFPVELSNSNHLRNKLLLKGLHIGISEEVIDNCAEMFDPKYQKEDLPNTEELYKKTIRLPFSNNLKEKDINKIASAINNINSAEKSK